MKQYNPPGVSRVFLQRKTFLKMEVGGYVRKWHTKHSIRTQTKKVYVLNHEIIQLGCDLGKARILV